jgi:two-component system chemotaxis response regulator CheY
MKVLIVEDEPISKHLLEVFLHKWGYDVVVCRDGGEAWKLLQMDKTVNLIISDWMMPVMTGLELCRKIRETERSNYIYFIILTSKKEKEDVIAGLEAGADDFLIKPFDREELKYRVKIGERIINLEQRIIKLASTDPLTGILNRRAFMERVNEEIHRATREKRPLSLIMSDIDHFKRINDTYGHQAGDRVLQRFARELTESSRAYDFVGRYGGEEFVACLPGADTKEAGSTAERIRRRVEAMKIVLPDRPDPVQITASFGTSTFRPASEDNLDQIFKRADDALYKAKKEGRNRVCTANGS